MYLFIYIKYTNSGDKMPQFLNRDNSIQFSLHSLNQNKVLNLSKRAKSLKVENNFYDLE